jgi:BolA family transcriptional regulator, general stress-responsive regulator
MSVATDIEQKLRDALNPTLLEVIDDSHQHAGHMGARPGGETHFTVKVVAIAFEGLNRVARQRLVYKILAEEMAGPVHALAIEANAA